MNTEDFYTSPHWRQKRKAILRRDGYVDKVASRYGKTLEATIVHHIFPLDEYPEYRLTDWNLISVSLATHNKLHDRETNRLSADGVALLRRTAKQQGINMERIVLVIGLAGSGKTTYVKNHIGNGLAYDLDYIASAFRLSEPHAERHDDSRRMANDLLRGFCSNVLEYTSKAYIIRTAPNGDELEAINPDKIVVCQQQYDITERPDYKQHDTRRMVNNIDAAIAWANRRNVPIERI